MQAVGVHGSHGTPVGMYQSAGNIMHNVLIYLVRGARQVSKRTARRRVVVNVKTNGWQD